MQSDPCCCLPPPPPPPAAAAPAAAVDVTGSVLPNLIDMLVKLYSLHQPLVNRHTSEVLAAVTGSSSSHLGTGQLAQLLGMLIDGEAGQLLAGGCCDPSLYVVSSWLTQAGSNCQLLQLAILERSAAVRTVHGSLMSLPGLSQSLSSLQ